SVPLVDPRPGRQPRRRTWQGEISRNTFRRNETDRATRSRMRGLPVDIAGPGRDARHSGVSRALADELESWGIGRWSPLGEKLLDCPINWKLAIDTFAENYHFATVHKTTFATIACSNCTVFDSFGPHHRLVFPLNGILDLENAPEEQWDQLHNMVVIYALFPNIVLSCTIANGN